MKLIILGGGCWGHHHASGLLKAKAAGRAAFDSLVVVDRREDHRVRDAFGDRPELHFATTDWSDFLVEQLDELAPEDRIVPAPVAPHLFLEWLLSEASRHRPEHGWERVHLHRSFGTPFESLSDSGERFVSYAEWLCPPNCVEPLRCPAIKAQRTWEMPLAVMEYARDIGATPIVLHSRQYAWGIAALPVGDLVEARERVLSGDSNLFAVATVSACHGAIGAIGTAKHADRISEGKGIGPV